MDKSIFQVLSEIDITSKIKKKDKKADKMEYLPWSSAWAFIKDKYPNATYKIVRTDTGCIYHTDNRYCWVETELTIGDEIQSEILPVLDFRNQAVTFDSVTTSDVNKAIKRCLVKNAALFGLGLSLWNGEELSDTAKEKKANDENELKSKQTEIITLASQKIEGGADKEKLYGIISANNEGKKNPNSIKSVEICNKIIEEINKM